MHLEAIESSHGNDSGPRSSASRRAGANLSCIRSVGRALSVKAAA